MIRSNLTDAARRAQQVNACGTPRKIDDKHLCQEVKELDTYHSHTASSVQYRQPAGHTAVVLDQFEEEGAKPPQQKSSSGGGGQTGEPNQAGEWNHDQPKGKSAEAVVTYIGAQQSHPIVTAMDDRRVRPYAMKPGESAHYATSGTGQMLFHNDDGSYLVSLNEPSEKPKSKEKQRMASLRHVNKKKQKREIKEDEQVPDHKHEGESVNTEVRTIKDHIEFYAPGDKLVGVYDKKTKRWFLDVDAAGKSTTEMLINKIVHHGGARERRL